MPDTSVNLSQNLIEACAKPGCPLCRLADHSVEKYLEALMYELVNDPDSRDHIRASLGYCHPHAHRLLAIAGMSLGTAIIYRDLVNTVAARLESAQYEKPRAAPLRAAHEKLDRARPSAFTTATARALTSQAPCPVCQQLEKMEQVALGALVDTLTQPGVQTALQASAGLCVPHLRRALQLVRSRADHDFLVALATTKLTALRAELDEFIRKNDYRFRHEKMGAEGDSWKRGVAQLVGEATMRKT